MRTDENVAHKLRYAQVLRYAQGQGTKDEGQRA